MKNKHSKEVFNLSLLLLLGGILGFAFGHVWLGLFLGSLIYINFLFWELRMLQEWIVKGEGRFIENGMNSESKVGEPFGLGQAVKDRIQAMHTSQENLRVNLEKDLENLRGSFSSLPDSVVMLDASGKIDWCNATAEKVLGIDLLAEDSLFLVDQLSSEALTDYFDKGNFSQNLEIASPCNADRTLLVQITCYGEGRRLLFARDVTELYQLDNMRRDFVSNVSHELRTPLTVISGYIENFELFTETVPEIKKPLLQMHQNAKRMEALIYDLLELSRLETMPVEENHPAVSLNELARSVVDEALVSSASYNKQITVTSDEDVSVFGVTLELHSVLLNLVMNACKYTEDNGHIEIRCWADDEGAHMAIKDDGVGIHAEDIPRLTERFYRVDKSRSIDTGGTGLGLAIVKHVLQRHDAMLDIQSTEGEGSVFICRFPVHRKA